MFFKPLLGLGAHNGSRNPGDDCIVRVSLNELFNPHIEAMKTGLLQCGSKRGGDHLGAQLDHAQQPNDFRGRVEIMEGHLLFQARTAQGAALGDKLPLQPRFRGLQCWRNRSGSCTSSPLFPGLLFLLRTLWNRGRKQDRLRLIRAIDGFRKAKAFPFFICSLADLRHA